MTFRRLAVIVATVAVAAFTVGACSGSPGSGSAPLASAAAATAAPANGAEVDAAGFAAALKRPGTVVLDVRTPAEFAAGHLAGAEEGRHGHGLHSRLRR